MESANAGSNVTARNDEHEAKMATTLSKPPAKRDEHAFEGFDRSVEAALGADLRLIYGLGAPVMMIVGLIVILALTPATWLVISIIIIEIGALGLVVTGLMAMLDERDEDDATSP